jgi:hypothetical protein
MKYAILLFVCLLSAVSSRADGGTLVSEDNVLGTISFTNGVVTESIVFDVQLALYNNGGIEYGIDIGTPYEISTGPLGDFSQIGLITTGPAYLAFDDAAGDEIDLVFASPAVRDITLVPAYAEVYGCRSQACLDNFSIDGLTIAIGYPGALNASVTPIPVVEPSEVGMLLVGLVCAFGLARFRTATALP